MKKPAVFFKAGQWPVLVSRIFSFEVFAKDAPQQGKRSESEFLSLLTERGVYLVSLFYGVTFGGFVGLANSIWSFQAATRIVWRWLGARSTKITHEFKAIQEFKEKSGK